MRVHEEVKQHALSPCRFVCKAPPPPALFHVYPRLPPRLPPSTQNPSRPALLQPNSSHLARRAPPRQPCSLPAPPTCKASPAAQPLLSPARPFVPPRPSTEPYAAPLYAGLALPKVVRSPALLSGDTIPPSCSAAFATPSLAMALEGEQEREGGYMAAAVVGEMYCVEAERQLTVRKTSVFYPGDGFAAYDHSSGDLVFRVDTYGRGPSLADELVLMDPTGASILTVSRKWPSLHQRWEGFLGERSEGQRPVPIFTVRKPSIFGGDHSGIAVEVHGDAAAEYRVEGSFAQRCCKVVHEGEGKREVVAEIKRKVDASAHVVLGRDVFCLCLRPGFDAAFAMGLVLILDQISSDDDGDATPTVEEDDPELGGGGAAEANRGENR